MFEATLALLATRHGEVNLETVAERAGVSKTTIYRRWPSKVAVITAAVSSLYLDRVEVPDTASLSDDLVTLLTDSYRQMTDGSGRVLERLVRASSQHPELVEVVRSIVYARGRAYATRLNHAIARGELPPDVDQELLLDLLLGPLWLRLLLSGAPITPEAAGTVVRLVLEGAMPRGACIPTGAPADASNDASPVKSSLP